MTNLYSAASLNAIMRDELLRAFPGLADDTEALADTLEGASNFKEAVAYVMNEMDEDQMLIAAINQRMAVLTARRERLELRAERMRAALCQAMERAGEKRVTLPECTVSLATVPGKVIIIDESLIPDRFMVYPEAPPPRPDKLTLARALKEGIEVEGATLSNGSVTVKVRRT